MAHAWYPSNIETSQDILHLPKRFPAAWQPTILGYHSEDFKNSSDVLRL